MKRALLITATILLASTAAYAQKTIFIGEPKIEVAISNPPAMETPDYVANPFEVSLDSLEFTIRYVIPSGRIYKCRIDGTDTLVMAKLGDGPLGPMEIESYDNYPKLARFIETNGKYANQIYKRKEELRTELSNLLEDSKQYYMTAHPTEYAAYLTKVEEQQRAANAPQELAARKRMLGDYETEFTEPTGPIQTKSLTNELGAKVTYQYYVNENGYEVKHGKYTVTMSFKDHKYWVGGNYGFIHVTGTETLTETYRNGILHGPLTYKCNANTSSTFGNPELINRSYKLNIYKGFLTGDFKFSYNGITYTGKAINGILEYCNYQTDNGFHGKLTSNPNSKSVSVAEINNGNRTFEFDSSIELPSIIATMPMIRFPLIGN